MIEFRSVRCVGKTPLILGPLGLGVAPLGNLYTTVSDAQANSTLARASEHGVRWFDVAPLYGLGLAERRLGTFLKDADSVPRVISTKVGRVLEAGADVPQHDQFIAPLPNQAVFDYSSAGIERSYEQSLIRLGLDRVSMLLLHDVDRLSHSENHRTLMKQILDESLPTLQRLKSEGRIDALGLGINQWDVGYEILASAEIDCVLLAGRYTLLDQTAWSSGFLDACFRRRVSVLAGGVLNGGFLAGGSFYDYCPATEALIEQRNRLLKICERHHVVLSAAAIQFTAAHHAVTSLSIGARSAQEVDTILEWSRTSIPIEFWEELSKTGFISNDTPYPP